MLIDVQKIQSKPALIADKYRVCALVLLSCCLLGCTLCCVYLTEYIGKVATLVTAAALTCCALYLSALLTMYTPGLFHYTERWQRTAMRGCTLLTSVSFITLLSIVGATLGEYGAWVSALAALVCAAVGAVVVRIADKAIRSAKDAIEFANKLNAAIVDKDDVCSEIMATLYYSVSKRKQGGMYTRVRYDFERNCFAPQMHLRLRPDIALYIFSNTYRL